MWRQKGSNSQRNSSFTKFVPDPEFLNLHLSVVFRSVVPDLSHMEKAYLDEHIREYELTRHFSLRLQFPMAFLQLKTTGRCEIDIPEWMFDLDFPGQYKRRIRNVSLTIPCIVGPYTGVHCRLTLLSSMTRIDPRLMPPPNHCCCDHRQRNEYETCPHDPRFVRLYAATEAITTSSGQNDSGMFELNFRDERYLPFEYLGAISRWRIELPPENNQFDFDTLTDVILHLNYTAREGGEALRRAANEVAQHHLPGSGVRYFDIRHEFPDAWHRFQGCFHHEEAPKHLGIRISRDMFPFIPGHKDLWINRLYIFFEAPDVEPGKHKTVKLLVEQRDEERDGCKVYEISCVASEEWPDLYYGALDIRLGPLAQRANHDLGMFSFPPDTGVPRRAFLLCGYEVTQRHLG